MGTTQHSAPRPTSEPPSIDELAAALKHVARKGLPIGPDDVPQVLLALRGVYARSVNPADYLSRVRSLNQLLSRMLIQLGEGDEAVALRILFGLPAENRGITLTLRRERAATAMGYGATHFRKHIEGRLLRSFSWLLHDDSQSYTPRSRTAPPMQEISGDTPSLTSADVNEQEELVSRIWALVYELRAELIRNALDEETGAANEQGRLNLIWVVARLLTRIHDYLERYGDRILHGEGEFRAEGLVRLAGWSHDLTQEEATHLRYALAKAGEFDRKRFVAAVRRDQVLGRLL